MEDLKKNLMTIVNILTLEYLTENITVNFEVYIYTLVLIFLFL